jgi:hypothetical protein
VTDDVPHIRLREDRCPYCGEVIDSASTLEGEPPLATPGDMSLCFYCAEVAQFGADFKLKKMSTREIAMLSPEEAADLKQTQDALRAFLQSEKR